MTSLGKCKRLNNTLTGLVSMCARGGLYVCQKGATMSRSIGSDWRPPEPLEQACLLVSKQPQLYMLINNIKVLTHEHDTEL